MHLKQFLACKKYTHLPYVPWLQSGEIIFTSNNLSSDFVREATSFFDVGWLYEVLVGHAMGSVMIGWSCCLAPQVIDRGDFDQT